MSGDFIGYCIACGCHLEEDEIGGYGFSDVIEEKYQFFGRFANWMQQMKFKNGGWSSDNPTFKTEAPFFYTLRGICVGGGTSARFRCSNTVPRNAAEKVLYERDSAGNWSFPIHECCLAVLDQASLWSQGTGLSITREIFYDFVCQQAVRNDLARHLEPDNQGTRFPGVSWEHGYYGAQRLQGNESRVRIGGNPLEIKDLSSYLRLHLGLTIHGPPQKAFPDPPQPESPVQQAPISCSDHLTIHPPSTSGSTDETSTSPTRATIPPFRHETHQTGSPLLSPQSAVHDEQGLPLCMSATGDPQRILGAPIPPTCPGPELPRESTPDAVPSTDSERLAPLLTIPAEILDLILADLPPKSVVSLHDSCKILAARLPLDQRFWRDGLLSNHFLGFTWDLDNVMSDDEILRKKDSEDALDWEWKGLGKVLAREAYFREEEEAVFKAPGFPEGLKARKRIWRCIVEIARSRTGDSQCREMRL